MNKGSILKRFLYFLLAFLILIIDQVPTIYLGVKDIRLVCLLIFILLLMSAGALFLGKSTFWIETYCRFSRDILRE